MEDRVSWIESDHAPHRYSEKMNPSGDRQIPSGIPVFPVLPLFIQLLKTRGIGDRTLERLTGENVEKTYKISIHRHQRGEKVIAGNEYEFEPFTFIPLQEA